VPGQPGESGYGCKNGWIVEIGIFFQ
jgi:hypothetical protein